MVLPLSDVLLNQYVWRSVIGLSFLDVCVMSFLLMNEQK
ncbi:hypothetical protein A464_3169 [Salmonella bongori N268-08]|uniref:Uncharacterized protein n=1 Tax=Salmonella bongori N268-08 TaxID=1197719 RepID=S5N060_SALBN|nr:hypothetical protein A464_3169 [Salmonella bongori N268-08]